MSLAVPYLVHVRNTSSPERGTWAALVTETRERTGMTKSELARRLKIDRGTVHRWETGKNRPEDAATVHAFAELFGLDVDEVLAVAGLRIGAPPAGRPVSEPPLDPDLLIIMRRLNDPMATEAEKATLRGTLRYLADLAKSQERSTQDRRAAS